MKSRSVGLSCIPGLEELASAEVRNLGFEIATSTQGFLQLSGSHDERAVRRLLENTRFVLRVLGRVYAGSARSADQLRRALSKLPWIEWMKPGATFRVDVHGRADFASTQYLPLVVKDAVVDCFRALGLDRPEVDTRNPHLVLVLHCEGDRVELSSDAAGVSLNFRGYRSEAVDAPLNECIAAALSKFIGFEDGLFVDPMCGSGTVPIEAALRVHGLFPAASLRQGFALDKWPDAVGRVQPNSGAAPPAGGRGTNENHPSRKILGFDRDPKAIAIASRNAARAGLGAGQIHFEQESFEYLHANSRAREAFEWAADNKLPVYLVMNPPFDKRLGLEDAAAFYAGLGDTLKQHWRPSRAGIFTANLAAAKRIGLRSEARHIIRNGPLDCRFIVLSIH